MNGPDAGQVSRMLAGQAERLCLELLSAGKRRGPEWQVGSVGNEPGASMSVRLSGAKAGVWADFSTGERGDALDLVAAVLYRGDRKAAFAWGLRWLGYGVAAPAARAAYVPPAVAKPDPDEQQRQASALGLWLAAEARLEGTPVEAYLAGRGIELAHLARTPAALRWQPACWCAEVRQRLPAMVAIAHDGAGKPSAVHRTWLARTGTGWGKARLVDPKKSLGRMHGATIRLQRGASGKALADAPEEEVLIGEGIETCLSVAVAMPERRVLCGVSLANIAAVQLPVQIGRVLLLLDNDSNPKAVQGMQRVLNVLHGRGLAVRIARSPRGKDFNDCLAA